MGESAPAVLPMRRVISKVATFLEAIKFEHSVFALPFAVLSAFLASDGVPGARGLTWIVVAMIGARTFGMSANRLIDAAIDARNPRTAKRALPAGLLGKTEMLAFMVISLGVFGIAVSQLDRLAWFLSPVVPAVMVAYPYLKRFTWLAHVGLGTIYLIVPPATAIALTGSLPGWSIWMGCAGLFWVAGFDIIYATADVEVDRAQRLHSLPARFGIGAALWISRTFHLLAVGALIVAGAWLDAGIVYFLGVAAVALLLAFEQSLVSPRDLTRLNAAFFTMNGVIAVVFAVFACAEAVMA